MIGTTLLIDGDAVVYRFCLAAEEKVYWGLPDTTRMANFTLASYLAGAFIKSVQKKLSASAVIIALGDTKDNFRKDLLPEYKSNRLNKPKPILYTDLRRYLSETFIVLQKPRLEADDVLGILHTKADKPSDTILVSNDKDFQSIPGKLYNPWDKKDQVKLITEEEAEYNHMMQTLTGDTTDCYKGIPGIGPVKANKILSTGSSLWQSVVEAYEDKGLTEADALVQARVARICRHSDWDTHKQEVILWKP